MISPSFNIKEFLDAMVGRGFVEIFNAADQECGTAEHLSRGKKGKAAKEMGSMSYAASLKALLFFLRFGRRPASISDKEFALYRPVCEELIRKGELLPSVLELFK